ncbi:chloroplast sensor kinase, chloroplastic-like [Pistacia vera]|uniref:chloroplast sensor kinase, chloroplastic-like n=1 Tax=Pistacia vera TaxID=55513 RepID=UPI001263B503|nr:chloroplast sensor kinase, chloroplastic-like [Pistacia vera]
MLLSAVTPQSLLSNPNTHTCNFLYSPNSNKFHSSLKSKPLFAPSSSLTTNSTSLRHVTRTVSDDEPGRDALTVTSASAIASAIRRISTSPVEFLQRIEDDQKTSNLVLPSPDFQKLCVEQLDLFRRIVDSDAIVSVYVRPAGSYVMDRLELRRVVSYPGVNANDIVILVGNFSVPTGLRAAEAALSSKQVQVVPEQGAVVFPMVKQPFVVGFLVAELQMMESEGGDLIPSLSPEEAYALPPGSNTKAWEIETFDNERMRMYKFTPEQKLNAVNICRSLAMAYVMDQKSMLLQQSSWQNNLRMSNLVEQIRGPLSSIQTLSNMLSLQLKRSEISYDIVENIKVEGDRIRGTLQELQDAVQLTKANIVHYNEESLKKMHNSTFAHLESIRSQLSDKIGSDSSSSKLQNSGKPLFLSSTTHDLEMPMPPLALAPLKQHGIRPCNVSDVLVDLVEAVIPLAHMQQRVVELSERSQSLQVAVEEPALRQALSNLIEGALLRTNVGGKVEIVSAAAPAGGALVVIDDDGPDMHYMTQMHSLTPFGVELFSENMVEDNMTWNFVAGLTVARELLESYGCVIRVISPRTSDAALGSGGTRVELWLPSFAALSD